MRFILFLFISHFTIKANSQLLKGQWKGVFKDNGISYPLYIDFIQNSDSSYSVFSYSQPEPAPWFVTEKQSDSAVVCKVFYKFTPPDLVYLEEIEAIQPSYIKQDCFQKMNLKIVKKGETLMLVGTWVSDSKSCHGSGKISFKKIE